MKYFKLKLKSAVSVAPNGFDIVHLIKGSNVVDETTLTAVKSHYSKEIDGKAEETSPPKGDAPSGQDNGLHGRVAELESQVKHQNEVIEQLAEVVATLGTKETKSSKTAEETKDTNKDK